MAKKKKPKKCVCKEGYWEDVWFDADGKSHKSRTICLLCKGTGERK